MTALMGLNWFPTRQRGLRVSRDQSAAGLFTPSSSPTGDDFMFYAANVLGSPVAQVDVETVASVVENATVTTDVYRPNADGYLVGAKDQAAATSGLSAAIDETSEDIADYIVSSTAGTPVVALFEYGASGFATSKRPLRVRVAGLFSNSNNTGPAYLVTPYLSINGVLYAGEQQSLPYTPSARELLTYDFEFNPAHGGAWSAQRIQLLDNGVYAGWSWDSTSSIHQTQGWVEVDSVPETRLAAGHATVTEGGVMVQMLSPGDVDTWALVSGTPYQFVVSIPSGEGSFSVRGLDSGSAHPSGFSSRTVQPDDNRVFTVPGDADTAALMFALHSDTGVGLYGQPYSSLEEIEVYTGHTVEQEITLPGTTSRGWQAFVARMASTATVASLLGKLRLRAGGAQVGGTVTVTPHDVRDAPRLAQKIGLPAASGAVPTAAQHYLEWSCAAAQGLGWLVMVMVADAVALWEGLTSNQQSLETDTTGWTAGANATIARVTTQRYDRTAALSLTSSSGTGTRFATTPTGTSGVPVVAGDTVSASAQIRSGVSRTARLKVVFYAGGSLVSTVAGTDITTSTTAWTQASVTTTAPATATFMTLIWEVDAVPAAELHYGDAFSLKRTARVTALTQGGTTDVATIGGVEDTTRDAIMVVGQTYSSPANQAVTAVDGHAHVSWDQTSLGVDFGATVVQRLHPSGWFDLYRITTESITSADDYEAMLGVQESYRVLAETGDGIRSTPPSPVTVTVPAGKDVLLTSNQSPDGNTTLSFETLDVALPELVSVTPTNGRYGQRVVRSSDNLGETLAITLDLYGAEGADLWRTIIARLRDDLPYLCVLSPTGDRWFVGEASASVGSPKFDYAQAPISLVEVTDTPSIVLIT